MGIVAILVLLSVAIIVAGRRKCRKPPSKRPISSTNGPLSPNRDLETVQTEDDLSECKVKLLSSSKDKDEISETSNVHSDSTIDNAMAVQRKIHFSDEVSHTHEHNLYQRDLNQSPARAHEEGKVFFIFFSFIKG